MAYEVCRRCSKMFEKNGKSYCQDCIGKTEKEHDLIIEYIRKFPDASIIDIISETGVTLKSIQCLVDDGYVSYKDNKLEKRDKEEILNAKINIMNEKNKFHIRRMI